MHVHFLLSSVFDSVRYDVQFVLCSVRCGARFWVWLRSFVSLLGLGLFEAVLFLLWFTSVFGSGSGWVHNGSEF